MNLTTAIETMRYVLALEARLDIKNTLQKTIESISVLVSSPADAGSQQNVRAALDNLANRWRILGESLSEANAERLKELGAEELFPVGLYDSIVDHFNANIATPAVTQHYVQQVSDRRKEILMGFEAVLEVADNRGWEFEEKLEGSAEVGFTIPRAIFDNKLKGFTKELDWINRLMTHVTEATTGGHEEFQITRLSTTDPTVFLAPPYGVAIAFGGVVTWALNAWKTFEEIRKIRAETAKHASFSADEVDAFFGSKIKQQIDIEIDAKASELTAKIGDEGRRNELHTGLSMLLHQFMQRVERGMTVEIRLIGQQDPSEDADETEDPQKDELHAIAASLKFPEPSAVPVLQLTGGAAEAADRAAKRTSRNTPKPPGNTA